MRTKHAMTVICLGLMVGFAADSMGGGFAALGRYLRKGSYEPHRRNHCGYTNCQQPWQPITSRMHNPVLPPGMRNIPLTRKWPGIAPQTPLWWRKAATPPIVRPEPEVKTSHLLQPLTGSQSQQQVRTQPKPRRRTYYGRHADVRYRGKRNTTPSTSPVRQVSQDQSVVRHAH